MVYILNVNHNCLRHPRNAKGSIYFGLVAAGIYLAVCLAVRPVKVQTHCVTLFQALHEYIYQALHE